MYFTGAGGLINVYEVLRDEIWGWKHCASAKYYYFLL